MKKCLRKITDSNTSCLRRRKQKRKIIMKNHRHLLSKEFQKAI